MSESAAPASSVRLERPLGSVKYDSLEPRYEPGISWLAALVLVLAFALGGSGWHWCYLLPLFWLLVALERRRLGCAWEELRREAITEAFRTHSSSTSDGVEWLNCTLRSIWPLYEHGMSEYVRSKLVKVMGDSGKMRLRGFKLGEVIIKDLSFGRPAADDPLPPLYITTMKVLNRGEQLRPDKSKVVRVELQANAKFDPPTREGGGGKPGKLVLQMKFLDRIGVFEVVVTKMRMEATMIIALEFVEPYPWLGTISFSFVDDPTLRFEVEVMNANLTDIPGLQPWLGDTIRDAMVHPNHFSVPLYAWYGEKPTATAAAAYAIAIAQGLSSNESLARSYTAADAAAAALIPPSPPFDIDLQRSAARADRAAADASKAVWKDFAKDISSEKRKIYLEKICRATAAPPAQIVHPNTVISSSAIAPIIDSSTNDSSTVGWRSVAQVQRQSQLAAVEDNAARKLQRVLHGRSTVTNVHSDLATPFRKAQARGQSLSTGKKQQQGGRAEKSSTRVGTNGAAPGNAAEQPVAPVVDSKEFFSRGTYSTIAPLGKALQAADEAPPLAHPVSGPDASLDAAASAPHKRELRSLATPLPSKSSSRAMTCASAYGRTLSRGALENINGGNGSRADGGGLNVKTVHAADFFTTNQMKTVLSVPSDLGLGGNNKPPSIREQRAATVDGLRVVRTGDAADGRAETDGTLVLTNRNSSDSSMASTAQSCGGSASTSRAAEPVTPVVGTPVGLLHHLAHGSATQRASAEAKLRAGIAVLRLRVVSLVQIPGRDKNLTSPPTSDIYITAAVAALEASKINTQKGHMINAGSLTRHQAYPFAHLLRLPDLERSTWHILVNQDFWLPVQDAHTQRLWIALKVKEASEERQPSSGSVGLADLVFGATASRAVHLADVSAVVHVDLTLDLLSDLLS